MRQVKVNQAYTDADIEELHRCIVSSIESGDYDSYIDALADYVEKYDINLEQVSSLVSPALKNMIYEEALNKNLLCNPHIATIPDNLF